MDETGSQGKIREGPEIPPTGLCFIKVLSLLLSAMQKAELTRTLGPPLNLTQTGAEDKGFLVRVCVCVIHRKELD